MEMRYMTSAYQAIQDKAYKGLVDHHGTPQGSEVYNFHALGGIEFQVIVDAEGVEVTYNGGYRRTFQNQEGFCFWLSNIKRKDLIA
jgi:hypothetical protein